MAIKECLANQFRHSLSMLRECIEKCPEELWEAGTHPRFYWRLAYHAVYFTDRYLQPSAASFRPWKLHRRYVEVLWGKPAIQKPYTKAEVLSYLDLIDTRLPHDLESTDLTIPTSGFPIYEVSKLELQFVNLRHLQHHVGQLSEVLMEQGIYVTWSG